MNKRMQIYGLGALTLVALVLLGLVAWVLHLIASHIGPDGSVPSAEAFGFTALLLAFREVVGAIRALWEHEDRANLTNHLASSLPPAGARHGAGE